MGMKTSVVDPGLLHIALGNEPSLVKNHLSSLVALHLEDPFEPDGSMSLRELDKVPSVVVDDGPQLLLHSLAPALLLFSFSKGSWFIS
jgi:hypothetical protein